MTSSHPADLGLNPADIGAWYRQKATADPLAPRLRSLLSSRICIMGAAGQVGSHLVAKLYELGIDLEQIDLNDNLSLGRRDNLPPPCREGLVVRSHRDYALNPPHRPDLLLFVGGRSSAPHFTGLADVLSELETWATLLDWCVAENIRLVFASTSSLCKQRPSREDQRVWPGSLYELCKLMMEDMAIQQSLDRGLQLQICRFFSVYGVTEAHKGKFANLYTQLLWHALDQTPFEVWGQPDHFDPGEQTRDLIFAPDVARAMLHLLTLPVPSPHLQDISDLVYNIGQGKPLSVKEMIAHMEAILPPPLAPKLQTVEVPSTLPNYVVHTWGDPQKLINSGYQPLFPENIDNLKFISCALFLPPDWYWDQLTQVRQAILSSTGNLGGGA
ncbi:NAD-dependent epimerase/dehydratase family protein [Lyngbya confervoides]|uniref:NAD-dependent epimerase/dehydratase family protein n=1 Tax=Lyngbya confervoides BDU141951 TaxID=1574623 RepID=A0ABD4T6R4_9CYAN|nr:NAD-dependent epimerase/dehydratase family protein [Lyngbya confervoides]MCM1983935.1 NAD-dependent epimerase/dehydratase family protein [Lyngbya confervoides BDU141951]